MSISKANFQFLDYLSSKGVRFAIGENGATHGGYFVDSEKIREFLEDPDALFAAFNGVTKSEYRDWNEAGRRLHCSAKTSTGKPCKGKVHQGVFLSAEEWVVRTRLGEYCSRHSEGLVAKRGLSIRT
jgi:hypothetical protein